MCINTSYTFASKVIFLAPLFSFFVVQVQEEGTAKVGRLEVLLHFTFGNETDVPPDSKMLS